MIAFTVPYMRIWYQAQSNIELSNVTIHNLASKRASSFFSKNRYQVNFTNCLSRFSSQLNTITQISQTKLDTTSLNGGALVKNPYVWSSISVSTNYQLIDIETSMRFIFDG